MIGAGSAEAVYSTILQRDKKLVGGSNAARQLIIIV